MKKWLISAVLFLSICDPLFSQKTTSYTASNGVVYTIGDTITLGVGSAPDGYFNYIYSGVARTILASLIEEAEYDVRLPEFFQGAPVKIKKIKTGNSETLFSFDTESWGGFVIDIENAIGVCEIAYCRPNGFLTQQEYEKLVLLYRAVADGIISEEKFNLLREEMIRKSVED